MLMEFHITLQGDFWWCRKNVVPLHYPRSNIMHGGINYFSITLKQKELWQQKEH